jgi:hypothetical protein
LNPKTPPRTWRGNCFAEQGGTVLPGSPAGFFEVHRRKNREMGQGDPGGHHLPGRIRAAKPGRAFIHVRFPANLAESPRHDATVGRGVPAGATSIN